MPREIKIFIGYCVLVGAIGFMFYNPYRTKKEIAAHSRYTVCTVFKESSSLKNGEHYHYYFFFKGKRYENDNSKNRNYTVSFGDRFIVNFSFDDPDYCKILYEFPIDNEMNVPDDGWSEVPLFIRRKAFIKSVDDDVK